MYNFFFAETKNWVFMSWFWYLCVLEKKKKELVLMWWCKVDIFVLWSYSSSSTLNSWLQQILFLFRISEKTLKRSFLSFYHLCTVLIMSYHCWERYHLVPDLSFEDDILFPYSLGFLMSALISWYDCYSTLC